MPLSTPVKELENNMQNQNEPIVNRSLGAVGTIRWSRPARGGLCVLCVCVSPACVVLCVGKRQAGVRVGTRGRVETERERAGERERESSFSGVAR